MIVLGLLCSVGCVSRQGYPLFGLQWPDLHPGTLDQQRARAALYDPYPDVYAGTPTESSRPREFAKPLAEPVKNRIVKESGITR